MNKKTKVLHIVGSLHIGGAENVAMNFLRYIDKNKYQCDYLLFNEKKDKSENYEKEAILLGANIIHIMGPGKQYITFYKKLQKILHLGKYDIVHSHTLLNNGIILKAAYSVGIDKRISHAHSTSSGKNENIIYKLYKKIMKKFIIKYATDYVACSQDAGYYLYGKKLFEKKGMIIPNGIEIEKYKYNVDVRNRMRQTFNINNKLVLGHVGRLSKVKNHKFLIDVFNEVHKLEKESVLMIIGDGELKNEIINQISKLKLDDSILIMGSRQNVSELLQAIDVFVFPSIFEGLGIAAVEAQAAGIYSIISDTLPQNLNITNNITRLSINANPKLWADEILKNRDYKRVNTTNQLKKLGFDISDIYFYIEKLYGE